MFECFSNFSSNVRFVNDLQVVYDHRLISFRQLLEIFWSSHDYRQVFGQGPDVGNQYR